MLGWLPLLSSAFKIAVTYVHVFYLLLALPLFTDTELGVFFVFFWPIPIIFPEFHHFFPERPILLNWHLNIC